MKNNRAMQVHLTLDETQNRASSLLQQTTERQRKLDRTFAALLYQKKLPGYSHVPRVSLHFAVLTSPDMRASFSNSRVNEFKVSVSNRARITSTAGAGFREGDDAPVPPPSFTPPAAASASASALALPCSAARVATSAALHRTLAVFLRCAWCGVRGPI